MQRIKQILVEYEEEMNNFELKKEGEYYFLLEHFSKLYSLQRRKKKKGKRFLMKLM